MELKADHSFAAFRYFIVPIDQLSLFDTVEEKRSVAVINFFKKATKERKLRYEIGQKAHILVYNRKVNDNILIFKFGRESNQIQYKEGETDIEDVLETNYPFVYLVFDITRQMALVEINTSVFQEVTATINKLQRCFEIEFLRSGFEVLFEEISDENSFWTYVDAGKPVYNISLTLNSPNLFHGWAQTSQMVHAIRNRYNNLKTRIGISNSKAPLTDISRENEELADAVKYTAAGGGEWKITTDTEKGRRTFCSRNNIKKISLRRIDDDTQIAEVNKEIIKALNSVENILPQMGNDDDKPKATD